MYSLSRKLLPALLLFVAGRALGADLTALDTVDRWLLTSGDAERIKVAAKHLVSDPGRPVATFDLAAAALDAHLRHTAAMDEDTAAWLVRALGASQSLRYRSLVDRAQAGNDKLERYAKSARDEMRIEGAAWTADAVDPARIRSELLEQKQRLPAPTATQFADVRIGVALRTMWPVLGPPDDIAVDVGNTYLNEWKNRAAADAATAVPPIAGSKTVDRVREKVAEVTLMVFEYRGLGNIVFDRANNDWVVALVRASSVASATANSSTLLLQQFREELRSRDPTIVRNAARRMVDALIDDESVLAEARAVVIDNLATEDKNMVDAMSLLCRALGQSSDAESQRVLKRVAKEGGSGKLRRWAERIAEQVEERQR